MTRIIGKAVLDGSGGVVNFMFGVMAESLMAAGGVCSTVN